MDDDQTQTQQTQSFQAMPLADPKAKMKKWIKIGIFIAVILVAINGFLYWQRQKAIKDGARITQESNQKIEEIRAKRAKNPATKKYQNSEFGFWLSYPSSWRTEECAEGGQGIVVFGETSEKMVHCFSEFIPVGPVAIQVIRSSELGSQIVSMTGSLENAVREDITLDGKPAVKISGTTIATEGPGLPPGQNIIYVLAYSDGKIFQIGLFEIDGKLLTGDFNRILESFKFIR